MVLLLSVLLSLQEPEKPTYFPTGNEATLVGTITLKGTPPKPKLIDMPADPVCQNLNRNPTTESVITNHGRLANVFVYVKGDPLNAYRFAAPESDVILNQRSCYFEPHVFGLQAGQNLQIINSDPTFHNVHPTPRLNPEWNYSQPNGAPPLTKTFRRAEVMIPIKCNQHPWMRAYVGVLNHPFFAVSDRSGKFEIRGLPAGTYKLVVWHEVYGEQEIDVTLAPGESRNADFTFDVDMIPGRMHP
jgi:plastocyanin